MLVVGLTGGIATGKSTVADMLRRRGAIVFDADRIAHETIAPGGEAWQEVLQAFGPGVRAEDGSIDRSRLGAVVFSDPEARARLEAIVHPKVTQTLLDEVERLRSRPDAAETVAVLEVPLLFEARLEWTVDKILLVTAEQKKQVSRLTSKRGLCVEAARQRISSQLPLSEKIERSDWVVDNSGSTEETERQVDALWPLLKRLAAGHGP
ncbi:MAG: dephospho-CoA kinase [Armatimonadetes bacterium]|nr:dephospho-CoA kinase [Armatimonadota bacterium]